MSNSRSGWRARWHHSVLHLQHQPHGQPAPTTTYTSFDAVPGKSLQIGFYGSAK